MNFRGVLCAFILLCFVFVPAAAQWVENGTTYNSFAGEITARLAVSDGLGGILILTEHTGTSGGGYLCLERVDGYGILRMSAQVGTAGGARQPQLISDGSGGAIVAAVRGSDLYAYRVDQSGSHVWGSGGIMVAGAGDSVAAPALAGDGEGGCFLAWQDMRSDDGDIYAQRLTHSGTAQWAAGGLSVCDSTFIQCEPALAPDVAGGMVVAWSDKRDSLQYDLYASRLSEAGTLSWMPNEVLLCAASGDQRLPVATSAGGSGTVFGWIDARSGNDDIYAQRLTGTGETAWAVDGIAVCSDPEAQSGLVIAAGDSEDRVLLAWVDQRLGNADIFAQKLLSNGTPAWLSDGASVCIEEGDQTDAVITRDGLGGSLVCWRDGRTDPDPDIYIQHLNSTGFGEWETNGVAVCDLTGPQTDPAMVYDGEGGALVSWAGPQIGSPSDYLSYCLRIERNGYWGYPAPAIFSVRDVPGDQGGFVNIAWDASRLDPWPYESILNYSVWRAINPTDVHTMLASGAIKIETFSDIEPESDTAQIRAETLDGDIFYWEFINYVYAASLEHYSDVVQTTFDSTGVCDEKHYFQIIAHSSSDAEGAWISAPDSGWSVDNLAPATPCSLTATQTGDDLLISWAPNTEADLSHYSLYRGKTEDFEPVDPVRALTGTSVVDTAWTVDVNDNYYKLFAYDKHGNSSPPALLKPDQVVATLLRLYSSIRAEDGILVEWKLSEIDNGASFRVIRVETKSGSRQLLSDSAIEREGLAFSLLDRNAEPGGTYRYMVEYSRGLEWVRLFETEEVSMPSMETALFQNHPNPFNPSTTIRYYLPESGRVTIDIVNVSGRRIRRLVDDDKQGGYHRATWDGTDRAGHQVSSGVYFYIMRSDSKRLTKKMTLLR